MSQTEGMDNRVTIMKGIGIVLMVLGHTACPHWLSSFVYMFHMPLFFIMSGYCFKMKYTHDCRTFVWRRVKGLYVPFVKYSLLFLILHSLFLYLNFYNTEFTPGEYATAFGWQNYLWRGMKIVGIMSGSDPLLGGFWFLKALFFASIYSLFIIKYVRLKLAIPVVLLLTIAMRGFNVGVRGIFDSLVMMSTLFFLIGHAAKSRNLSISTPVGLISGLLTIVASSLTPPLYSMQNVECQYVVMFVVTALVGTVFTWFVTIPIDRTTSWLQKALVWLGTHSIVILTWHFLAFKLINLLIIHLYDLPITYMAKYPVIKEYSLTFWPLYLLVGVGLPVMGYLTVERAKRLMASSSILS